MKNKKALAIIILSWITLYGNISSVNAAYANKFNNNSVLMTSIIKEDIIKYLEDNGYTLDDTPEQDGDDWTCYTHKGTEYYVTTVLTDGTNIIVHTDVRL
jgi:hypothetical protein